MKRLLLICAFCSSLSSFALLRLGAQVGPSISNGRFSASTATSSRTGFVAGAALELGLGAGWNLQFEGLYVQKGYKLTLVGTEDTYKYDYWEFPALFKYVIDIPIIKPFLMAGPYFAIKLKSEKTTTGTAITTALTGIRSTDIGLSFGGGADIYISPVSSLFGVIRYDFGLTDLNDPATTSTSKLNSLILMAGLMIGF